MAPSNGNTKRIQDALVEVKAAQADCDALVLFWDNASTHKRLETWGWERRIFFVSVPPYSPDLNLIEEVWKSTRRWVNQTAPADRQFVNQLDALVKYFQEGFNRVKGQLSFADSWWELYQDKLSWYSSHFQFYHVVVNSINSYWYAKSVNFRDWSRSIGCWKTATWLAVNGKPFYGLSRFRGRDNLLFVCKQAIQVIVPAQK